MNQHDARHWRTRTRIVPYVLVAPALVVIGAVLFYPMLKGFVLSLYDAKLFNLSGGRFVGIANYRELFSRPGFWHSIAVTVKYALCSAGGSFLIGFVFALVLHSRFKGRWLARGIAILPWAFPRVTVAMIWRWIYDPQYGILNYFLALLGYRQGFRWLNDASLALTAITVVTIWKMYPFATLMLLSGLQAIPDELYEAAEIDGAGTVGKFFYITLPSLRYVAGILALLLLVWNLGNFDYIFILTGGGPMDVTETLAIKVWLTAFKEYRVSFASAYGVVMLALSMVFSAFCIRLIYGSMERAR